MPELNKKHRNEYAFGLLLYAFAIVLVAIAFKYSDLVGIFSSTALAMLVIGEYHDSGP